ncbi:hypothetical protein HN51_069791, partial [Arachis hypogaea]
MHLQEEDAHFFGFFFPLSLGDGARFNIEKPSNEGLENLPSLGSEVEKIYATVDAAIIRNERRSETTDITPRMMLYLLLCGGALIIALVSFKFSRKGIPTEMDVLKLEEHCPSENEQLSAGFHPKPAFSVEKKRKKHYIIMGLFRLFHGFDIILWKLNIVRENSKQA